MYSFIYPSLHFLIDLFFRSFAHNASEVPRGLFNFCTGGQTFFFFLSLY